MVVQKGTLYWFRQGNVSYVQFVLLVLRWFAVGG
jgi:hypothetical protein